MTGAEDATTVLDSSATTQTFTELPFSQVWTFNLVAKANGISSEVASVTYESGGKIDFYNIIHLVQIQIQL